MKFSIYKSVLLKSLNSVGRAASVHSPLPVLSGIKLSVNEDGLLLLASDTNITIQELIIENDDTKLVIDKYGSVVLDARYILEAVRKLDSLYVNIEIIDGALTRISGNNAEYEINGVESSSYPDIDLRKPETHFNISAFKLKEIISQTAFAAATTEDRPIFTGVNFILDSGVLTAVSTNSYRLAKKTYSLNNTNDAFNITVPASNLNEVLKTINQNNEVEVYVSNKVVQFHLGETLIQSRLVDGLFPDVNRLIPTEFGYELTVNTHDLVSSIDRSSFLRTDGYWNVRLEASSEEIIIASRSQEIGSSHETLSPIDYKGGKFKIAFNGRYMIEALQSFKTDEVKILFVGEMQAFILVNPNDDSVVQLVLPVRTFD